MRAALVPALLALVVAGCGGTRATVTGPDNGSSRAQSPELVVLDWSDALNHELNEKAGSFFARGAVIVGGNRNPYRLHTRDEATAFNASFPCQGQIVSMSRAGNRVTATFLLGNRSSFACSAQYTSDTATFTVVDDKIVRMEILPD